MMFKRLRQISRYIPFVFPVALIAMYVWASVHMSSATAAPQLSVGTVNTVQGKGWSVSVGGEKFAKLEGDVVAMNEVVATGYKSGMTMSFIDSTTMKLGADAEITIDEMVYDPENGEHDSVVMTLKSGAFYFVSGKVAKQKVTLITPTTTIGIRGTELLISVDKDGSTSVGVAKGRAFVRSRHNRSGTDIKKGDTARTDAKGNVSDSHKGLDLTGDEDVDRNVEGVNDWLGDDDDKKISDITDFSSDDHEDDDKKDEDKKDDDKKDDDKEGDDEDRGDKENSDDKDENDGEMDGNDGEDQNDDEDGDSEGESDDGGDDGESDGDDGGDDGDSDGGDSDSDGGDSDGGDSDGGDSDSDGGDRDGRDRDSDRKGHD